MKLKNALAMGALATLGLAMSATVLATPIRDSAKSILLNDKSHSSAEHLGRTTKHEYWRGDGRQVIREVETTDVTTRVVDVPEPGSLALLALGVLGVFGMRRREQI